MKTSSPRLLFAVVREAQFFSKKSRPPWWRVLASLLGLLHLVVPSLCRGQATINVSSYDVVLHVDQHHPSASDSNSGTQSQPLKTIAEGVERAHANNRSNLSTRVMVHPGTYRETILAGWSNVNHSPAAISLEATQTGAVTISGSDVWNGWQRVGSSNVYTHSWPHNWGAPPDPWGRVSELGERKEMIFVDGVLLSQVLSHSEMNSRVNSFYVAEGSNTVYIHLPAGTNIQNRTIEVAVRPSLFRLIYANTVAVKGLRFQHANSAAAEHAVQVSGKNILIEDSFVEWNNWNGLAVYSADTTLRRVTANHNGAQGLTGNQNRNLLVEDSETSYNNWRAAMGGMISWAVGQKFLRARGVRFRRHTSIYNQAPGLWFDWDNEDVVVEDSFLCHNLLFGLFLEASQGPFTVKDNIICHNEVPSTSEPRGKGGIRITTSENITIEGNVLYGNERSQIATIPAAETRNVTNWETGQTMAIKTRNITIRNNAIVAKDNSQFLVELENWDHFFNSLVSDDNVWYNPENAFSFRTRYEDYNLSGWRSFTGQDSRSLFTDPLFVDPENGDFSTQTGSPWNGGGGGGNADPPTFIECSEVGTNNFFACYYDDRDFTQLNVTRTEAAVDFAWGSGSPHASIGNDTFSAVWQGNFTFDSAPYEFGFVVDDGARLYLDGVLILESWKNQPATAYQTQVQVSGGVHTVRMEYYEDTGQAVASLSWSKASGSGNNSPVAQDQSLTAPWNTPVSITLQGSDPDGDALQFSVLTPPNPGLLSGTPPQLSYAPPLDFTGVVTFTFQVSDGKGGSDSGTVSINIVEGAGTPNTPPVASFTATPSSGNAPLVVNFNAAGSSDPDGSVTGYSWSFGDGGNAVGATTSHVYSVPGVYTARLTVQDNNGATGTTTQEITVGSTGSNPVNGLAAHWSFDEGVGTTVADSSGNGNHGTVNGPTWTTGRTGNALSYDGSNDLVTMEDNDSLDIRNAITVGFWIKPETPLKDVLSKSDWNVLRFILDENGTNNVKVIQSIGGSTVVTLSANHVVQAGQWTHIAWRYNGSASQIFINGQPSGAAVPASGVLRTNSRPLWIGYWGRQTDQRYFKGVIDDLRIYDRALSNSEVQALPGAGAGDSDPNDDPSNESPIAAFSASPTSGQAPLSVSFDASASRDPDGNITSYSWNFGDGTSGTGSSANHTYTSEGSYTVTLTVRDNDGATGSANRVITASSTANIPPNAVFTATPTSGAAPLVVNFNGSASNDPDGAIANYSWSFGDGSSGTGSRPQHTYGPGTYTVTLTVTDNQGAAGSSSQIITVGSGGLPTNAAPVASFTATPTSGTAPLAVSFNGSASSDSDGSIVSYSWNFGDGGAAAGPATSRTYTSAGTYTATLTVTDNQGATGTATRTITVSGSGGSGATNGLVGYWSFDEGSGSVAQDTSGNGNHGTLEGATWANGRVGKALSFNGTNARVGIGDSTSLDVANAVTVGMWIRPNATLDDVVSKSHWNVLRIILHESGTNNVKVIQQIGGTTVVTLSANNVVSPGQWTHIAWRYDGSSSQIFINGQPSGPAVPASGTLRRNNSPLWIGHWGNATDRRYFSGLIDEVRIYSRALGHAEIQSLAQ